MKRNTNKKYYKYKVENLLNISKMVTVHYFEFTPKFGSVGESHDFWEMVYTDKGALLCERDDEMITIDEGEVIFHKPGEYHVHRTKEDTGANVFIISFVCKSEAVHFFDGKKLRLDRDLLKYIYMLIEESRMTFNLSGQDYRVKKMPLLGNPALGGTQTIKNLLEVLLIKIMRDGSGGDGQRTFVLKEDFDEYISDQVIEYLAANIHRQVTIDEICKNLSYTRSYLFRQFKSVTGQSIMSYFTSLKIKEAKRLLRETDMTVTQISASLAFDNPNYFSKTFKRVSGSTPLQYKKIRRLPNR